MSPVDAKWHSIRVDDDDDHGRALWNGGMMAITIVIPMGAWERAVGGAERDAERRMGDCSKKWPENRRKSGR